MNIDKDISKKMVLMDKALCRLKANNLFFGFFDKWQIPIGDIKLIDLWKQSLQESRDKYAEYQKELFKLALKADWPREDLDTFEDNLILGIYVFDPERVKVGLIINENTKEKELYLRLFGNTTKDDLRNSNLWAIISEFKKQLPNYTKRNYPDKNNSLRQRELDMSNLKKPKQIGYDLLDKFEKEEEKHPEISQLCDQTTGLQISKNIYKQKKILGIKCKK